MILFPNAKINLGLQVLAKRSDNYHEIETVLYPVPLRDIIEILPDGGKDSLVVTGLALPGGPGKNLVLKALTELRRDRKFPPVRVHLHKTVPFGSGLGGGSSDAAVTLVLCNKLFELGLEVTGLERIAGRIGSDCPFFIRNVPAIASGRGELLNRSELDLQNRFIIIVKPPFEIETREAYGLVAPGKEKAKLSEIVHGDPADWKKLLFNEFEGPLFDIYPRLGEIKRKLYDSGAFYASLSGSGSAVYGLFNAPVAPDPKIPEDCFTWSGWL